MTGEDTNTGQARQAKIDRDVLARVGRIYLNAVDEDPDLKTLTATEAFALTEVRDAVERAEQDDTTLDPTSGPVALWFLYQWKHDGRVRSEQRARVYELETDAAADAYRMHRAGHLPIGVQYPDGRTAHAISPWEWDAFTVQYERQEQARAALADLGPASRAAVSPFGPFGVHSAEGQVPADAPGWVGDQENAP